MIDSSGLGQTVSAVLAAGVGYMPQRASSVAGKVDFVFDVILWICIVFLAIIAFLTVFFVIRYRQRPWRQHAEPSASHNTALELLWSGIPLVLVVAIFFLSTSVWEEMYKPPSSTPADEVQVTAKKWAWWFDHPGGKGSNELHVVKGKPVRLIMNASDVLHSLYVPAFRIKQDVVPGRYTRLEFIPTEAGNFPLFCAEYCGTNHSQMLSQVVVHDSQAAYDAWIKERPGESEPLADVGKRVYETRGCMACHALDDSPRLGPSFKGLWGKQEQLTDGSTALVDENYIRESIVSPATKVVSGFNPVMPPTPLEERELQGIIEFIKSQKN